MRSRSELVSVHRGAFLRRMSFAILSLMVLMLLEGTPPPVAAQGVVEVRFSTDTLPISYEGDKPVLCQGQKYKILARGGYVANESGRQPELVEEVMTAEGALNSVTPRRYRRQAHDPMIVFIYDAAEQGDDAVVFESTSIRLNTAYRLGSKTLTLKVRECTYKITFVSTYQFAQGGVNAVNFGLMAETRLERNEDGTFAGNGSFVITNLVSSPVCTASYTDATIPNSITGKLLEDSGELELTFEYRKGSYVTDAECPRASAVTTTELDISGIAPKTMKISQEGGAKSFPLPGPGRGTLTIIVNKEVTNIAR